MNIKDVNSLTSMIAAKSQSSQLNTSSSAKMSSEGMEFISLVNSSEFATPANLSLSDANKVDIKPVHKESQVVENEKTPARENVKKEDKAEAKKPEADKKESAPSDKADKTSTQDKDAPATDNKDKSTSSSTEGKVSEENQVSTSENNQTETSVKDNVSEGEQPVLDNANPEGEGDIADSLAKSEDFSSLAAQLISLPQLSQMGAVTVFNAVEGTYSVMTGQELAAQIEAGNVDMIPVLSADNQSDITLLPQQTTVSPVQQATEEGIDISALTPVSVDETIMPEVVETAKKFSQGKETQTFSSQNQTNDDLEVANPVQAESKVVEQTAELSRRVGAENKAEVKVNVQEENFSYTSLRDVVVDKKTLGDTVSATQNTDENTSAQSPLQNNNASPLQNTAQQLNLFNSWAVSGGKVSAEASATNTVSGISALSDGASSVSQQAVAADTSSMLKTTARAEADNKTSFRDVYKGMSREVVDQIKVNITKSAVKGVDKIEIQLKPEDLGHIEIKMQISKDGKLQAHIISSRAETMDMLQKEMPSLEKAFNDAGFSLEDGSLSFSFRDDNQTGRETAENQNLRSFLGDVLDKSADNENSADLLAAENWDGKSALNIKV